MVRILRETQTDFQKKFAELLVKREQTDKSVEKIVDKIIGDIESKSDSALIAYTRDLDKFKISKIEDLIVSKKELSNSLKAIDTKVLKALKNAIKRIKDYHKKQIPKNNIYKDDKGVILGGLWNPVESVCLYVPGGTASYPSSLIMNAIPAIVAGVKRIVVTVPTLSGKLNPVILASAKLLGIREIYKIGGAQAIAALALGTKKINKVDKIVGPGNAYVATAKKKLFGKVGIDMIAGPSEILVIADNKNNPEHIALDLLSQAEHDILAQSILITDDESFAKDVILKVDQILLNLDRREIAKKSWNDFGAVIICKNLRMSADLVNQIAPEHLEIATSKAEIFLKKIKNAGAVFLGRYTPEAIGDYVAGPNHVLPTDRTAKFSSGLNVLDFFKRTSVVSCNKKNIKMIGKDAITLAYQEGLQAHALSIECRMK